MASPLRHVSDTALWVAMYRAFESERPDAIFRDPHARRMAAERGAAIVESMPKGRQMAWPMIVRTAVMDEMILRLTGGDTSNAGHQAGQTAAAVVNLAAGLDTRAFRLALPPRLRWFDVDLPDMIAYRQEHLDGVAPACVHEHVATDVTDAVALGAVLRRAAEAGRVLVVTEGLLVYLTADGVAALARTLHAVPQSEWWLTDIASPRLLEMLKKSWQPQLEAANAPMQFAPADSQAFFAPLGWREAEFRSTWAESMRLRRTVPLFWLWNALGKLRSKAVQQSFHRMSGMLLMRRT